MHYLLRYAYVADIGERRGPYRDEHLTRLWREADAGRVLLAGAAGDPVTSAVIVWNVDDPSIIDEFAKGDPYMGAGLITSYDVTPWNTAVGDLAAHPLRP